MILLFIYRILSIPITIAIVVPLWILFCVVSFLFCLFNNLIFINLIKMEVPQESLDSAGHDKLMFLKVMTAITIAFSYLWENLKNLKTIKF